MSQDKITSKHIIKDRIESNQFKRMRKDMDKIEMEVIELKRMLGGILYMLGNEYE